MRGLIAMVQTIDTQRTMEIDTCLTGVDREVTQRDLDQTLAKADLDFEHAAKVTPDYGEAWADRGVVHSLEEDYNAATTYFQKALQYPMRLDNPALIRAHLGGRCSTKKTTSRRRRSSAPPSSFSRRCASQLIGLRGFTSRVRNGKKPLNCSRRHPMIRLVGLRKPATT